MTNELLNLHTGKLDCICLRCNPLPKRRRNSAASHYRGACDFKARLLRAIDDIECSQLDDEEGGEYVLGPDFRPPSKQNIDALRAWLESFKI